MIHINTTAIAGEIVTETSALKVHINNNTALDQNGDGNFNIADVLVVINAVVNGLEIDADINGDSALTLLDVIKFMKKISL